MRETQQDEIETRVLKWRKEITSQRKKQKESKIRKTVALNLTQRRSTVVFAGEEEEDRCYRDSKRGGGGGEDEGDRSKSRFRWPVRINSKVKWEAPDGHEERSRNEMR